MPCSDPFKRCFSEAQGAGFRPAQPLGCGQKDMGISGPAQGQGIARGARKVCGWCCPPRQGCAGREPPCDEAMILQQRGAPAAFDRDAPCQTAAKTEVLCRPTVWFTTARCNRHGDPNLAPPRHPQSGLTNLGPSTLQCKPFAPCPRTRFDLSITVPSTWMDFLHSPAPLIYVP